MLLLPIGKQKYKNGREKKTQILVYVLVKTGSQPEVEIGPVSATPKTAWDLHSWFFGPKRIILVSVPIPTSVSEQVIFRRSV